MNAAARVHRPIPNDIAPFAIVRHPDGRIETCWLAANDDPGSADPTLAPGLAAQLEAYFAGTPVETFDVDLPPTPPFFARCWRACRTIPRGMTWSYRRLADEAGDARAVRAAGQAMRRNPLPVVVPCHRVVSQQGRLHGYGGEQDAESRGLRIKQALLAMEGASAGQMAEGPGLFDPRA